MVHLQFIECARFAALKEFAEGKGLALAVLRLFLRNDHCVDKRLSFQAIHFSIAIDIRALPDRLAIGS